MQITSSCSQVIAYLWAARACGPSVSPWFPSNPPSHPFFPHFYDSSHRVVPLLYSVSSPKPSRVRFFRSFDISPLIQITHTLLHIIALHYFILFIIHDYI